MTFQGVRLIAATSVAMAAILTPSAAGASAPNAESHGETSAEPAAPLRTDVLDLQAFRLRGFQPTDGEVIDLKFGIWLVMSESTTADQFHELARWKHRLRDQVIVAVRSGKPEDYDEPSLRRLQRLILLRLGRLDLPAKVLNVLVTDFSLDRGETIEDLMTPAITPSAAPARPASGGH